MLGSQSEGDLVDCAHAMTMTGPSASPLFASLADPVLRRLTPELSTVRLNGGDTLFDEGDPGGSLYVVVFGRLRAVQRDSSGNQRVLGEIGRGESVGEMALLTGEPRSATVSAIRDTELVKLTKVAFEQLVEREPRVMLEMSRLLIERYQRMLQPTAETRPVTLAVVPCHADVPIAEFAHGLVGALSPGRDVLWLDAARLRRERGVPDGDALDLDSPELAGWLHEQELQQEFLVYVGDPAPSPWTRLCVRQADVVLFVGWSGAAGRIATGLQDVFGVRPAIGARRELVLLYDSAQRMPEGTADWLSRIAAHDHHHLDPRRPAHYERLARMLTGNAVGLVLGGGGARGLAHIGVIRALEEAGVPIDLVGGTSAGAIVGGQLACGWDSARILEESRRVLVNDGSLNDYTLPLVALLRGDRYIRMLDKLFLERHIEDLPVSFFCVSANLTRSVCMVHRSGLVRRRVAASSAVPGLGPPIIDGRDLLVDGGIVNNLPIDIMRRFGRGPVVASSVSPRAEVALDRDYGTYPSPWRLLFSRLNPFGTPLPVPGIASTIMRTVTLQQFTAGNRARPGVDLVIEPSCVSYKLLDWSAIDRIMDTGYRAAVPMIERWQAERAARP